MCRLRGHSGAHSILIKKDWSEPAKGKENSMLFSCWAESDLTVGGGGEASLFYFLTPRTMEKALVFWAWALLLSVLANKDLRRDGSDNATNVAYLMKQIKSFARPSRAFFISVHFFPVLGKSLTWNEHFSSFTENVNTQRPILIFFPGFYIWVVPLAFKS